MKISNIFLKDAFKQFKLTMKKTLLIIDPQSDFCMPGASLYVNGADTDMQRLANFITEHTKEIDSIHISLDMHQYDNIAHPMYWMNKKSKHPEPFTNITIQDIKNDIWKTSNPENSIKANLYLSSLESDKKFTHTIWPYHCIAGTQGANIFPTLLVALKHWMDITGKSFHTHFKGMNSDSEHFGIFQSEDKNSKFNHHLCDEIFGINNSNEILVAGQAKSHCVAMSLKQILQARPENVKQIILLTDTTSNVVGFEHIADEIYENLRLAGMQELETIEIFKNQII